MHPYTEKQKASFERGKWLLSTYKTISAEHAGTGVNESVVAGDMIADIMYTMIRCYAYPKGDIESVEMAAFSSVEFDHTSKSIIPTD